METQIQIRSGLSPNQTRPLSHSCLHSCVFHGWKINKKLKIQHINKIKKQQSFDRVFSKSGSWGVP